MRQSGELLRRIGRIACPVLVIHGDADPHPIEGVVEPLRRLRDFHIVVLERCGHTPWQERYAAEPFYAQVEQQLAEPSDQSVL